MSAGAIVADGTPAEVAARYGISSLEDVFLELAAGADRLSEHEETTRP
jgi:hypothetical protein